MELQDYSQGRKDRGDEPKPAVHPGSPMLGTGLLGDASSATSLRRDASGHVSDTAYLDGLRGLMALLVCISHQRSFFYGTEGEADIEIGWGYQGIYRLACTPFLRLIWTGGIPGVTIFFVLSGYVLSKTPLRLLRDGDTEKCHNYLGAALFRRPIRLLLPPLVISLAFAFLLQLPIGLQPLQAWPPRQSNLFVEVARWWNEFLDITFPLQTNGVYKPWFPYDPPIWTIPVELRGSILVYTSIVAVSHGSAKSRRILFLVIGLYMLWCYEWAMFCFMMGMLLALMDLEQLDKQYLGHLPPKVRSLMDHVIFVAAWYLLCMPAGKQHGFERSENTPGWHHLTKLMPMRYFLDEYWRWWHSWGSLMTVYCVLRIQWLQRFFSWPKLQLLGKISFCLYLIHIPILFTVGDRLYRLLGNVQPGHATSWWDDRLHIPDIGPVGVSTRYLVTQAILIPFNMLVASYCTRWLDKTSIAWGHAAWKKLAKD